MTRPNILLLVIDQFRADLLDGPLAAVAGLSNLAALAKESVIFRQHYSVISPCGPSRVSLLTGQYGMNHRAVRNGTPLRHDTPNLARGLREIGYDPLLFGYTDTAADPRVTAPDDPRLTSYEELMPGFTEVVRMRLDSDDAAWRAHLADKGYDARPGYALYLPEGEGLNAPACYRAEDSDTAFLTDRFLTHMADADPGWCAMLTYIRPHPPLIAPAPYNTIYDPADMPPAERAEGNDPHPYLAAWQQATPARGTVVGFPQLADTPETTAQLRATYMGLAREVDDHIGRVIAWMKSSGCWDDTILIVTADHGEMLGDLGVWGKGGYHDACFHVPLMVRVPGGRPRSVGAMTESVDVAPTILDLAGAEIPHSMDGRSLRPWLEGDTPDWRDVSFSEHDFGNPIHPTAIQQATGLTADQANLAILRNGPHRLVHFAAGLPQMLFDQNDGGFTRDLAATPEGEKICLDLSRRMLCHRMANPEGTFAQTMITEGGVKTGQGPSPEKA